ncbi:hypothetical protein JCM8547_001560 [Rhodosporidiobolus lusitaniae]
MKRLFNKRNKSSNDSAAASIPPAGTPASFPSSTPSLNSSDNAGGAAPPLAPPIPPLGQGQQAYQQHQQQQQQGGFLGGYPQQGQGMQGGTIHYGPDGQAYRLVPVNSPHGGHRGAQNGIPRPPRVENVGNAVGWSCAMPQFEWAYVLALADYISQGSKKGPAEEAAKALRKEFKHATPTAQERAVRLTFLLARNSDHKFRQQIASKKFLSELENLVTDKNVDSKVKEMTFRVLSPLAFDFQDDPALSSLTQTYNKLLPLLPPSLSSSPTFSTSFPASGAPLSEDDPLLRPESFLSSHSSSSSSSRSRPRVERIPSSKQQMQELGRRAIEGRGYAGMLGEAVQRMQSEGRSGEEIEADEMVQEFHHQTLSTSEFISSNLHWASVQADQSRQAYKSTPTASSAPAGEGGEGLASNNPFAEAARSRGEGAGGGGEEEGPEITEEERVLGEMLTASSELSDALTLYSRSLLSSERAAREAADLAAALESSKTETRYDRFAAERNGHEVERSRDYGEGGSGYASPAGEGTGEGEGGYEVEEGGRGEMGGQGKGKGKGKARESRGSLNPYAAYLEEQQGRSASPASFGQAQAQHPQQPQQQQQHDDNDPYGGLDALANGLSLSSPPSAPSSSPYSAPSTRSHQPTFSSSNPYASLSASASHPSSQPSAPAASPFDDSFFSSSSSHSAAADYGTSEGVNASTPTTFLTQYVPSEPSQKALGKLRRVSVREDLSPDDVQQQEARLEEQLREKYRREYEEEQERRRE